MPSDSSYRSHTTHFLLLLLLHPNATPCWFVDSYWNWSTSKSVQNHTQFENNFVSFIDFSFFLFIRNFPMHFAFSCFFFWFLNWLIPCRVPRFPSPPLPSFQIFLNLLHFHLSRLIFNNFPNFPRFLFDVDDMKKWYPAIHSTPSHSASRGGWGRKKFVKKMKKSDGSASINL